RRRGRRAPALLARLTPRVPRQNPRAVGDDRAAAEAREGRLGSVEADEGREAGAPGGGDGVGLEVLDLAVELDARAGEAAVDGDPDGRARADDDRGRGSAVG